MTAYTEVRVPGRYVDKGGTAFEIALQCKLLARHLSWCGKCRRALRHHAPKRMCFDGHETVDKILLGLSRYDDDWEYLEYTLDGIR